MDIIPVEDFLENMDTYLDRVDAGEKIYISRNERIYEIVPVKGNIEEGITTNLSESPFLEVWDE